MIPSEQWFSADRDVLTTLIDWAHAGDRYALVTVVGTWGSSPRPPGSLLGIRQRDGRCIGSVSGGCVEEDLVARYRSGDIAACPTLIDYGVAPDSAARFGLPCGGQLELLVEEPPAATLLPIVAAISDGGVIERRVCLATGEASLHRTDGDIGFRYQDETVYKGFGPHWRVILVGAGQLADALARILLMLDFQVTLCDPRSEYDTALVDLRVERQMPDDLLDALATQARTAVVTLAHDPKLDDMALMTAVPGKFFYVGALGSKRTSASRLERLRSLGIDAADLARLHAPVGIKIGSRTPAEIAVAIAADLVAARRGVERSLCS